MKTLAVTVFFFVCVAAFGSMVLSMRATKNLETVSEVDERQLRESLEGSDSLNGDTQPLFTLSEQKMKEFENKQRPLSRHKSIPPPTVFESRDVSFKRLQSNGELKQMQMPVSTRWSTRTSRLAHRRLEEILENRGAERNIWDVDHGMLRQRRVLLVQQGEGEDVMLQFMHRRATSQENVTTVAAFALVCVATVVVICATLLYACDVHHRFLRELKHDGVGSQNVSNSVTQEEANDSSFVVDNARAISMSRVSSMSGTLDPETMTPRRSQPVDLDNGLEEIHFIDDYEEDLCFKDSAFGYGNMVFDQMSNILERVSSEEQEKHMSVNLPANNSVYRREDAKAYGLGSSTRNYLCTRGGTVTENSVETDCHMYEGEACKESRQPYEEESRHHSDAEEERSDSSITEPPLCK